MASLEHSDTSQATLPGPDLAGLAANKAPAKANGAGEAHPSGRESYGPAMQILRGIAFAVYFNTCCTVYVALPCPRVAVPS